MKNPERPDHMDSIITECVNPTPTPEEEIKRMVHDDKENK